MTGGESIWVALLDVSPAVAQKIASKHGIDASTVRAAMVGRGGYQARWEDHPDYGIRVIVLASDESGRLFIAWLQPTADPDVWNLRTPRYA